METLWWAVTLILMLAGLVGTVVPLVPGAILIFSGALVNAIAVGTIGWGTVLLLLVLMLMAQAVDFLSGAAGAKYFGASRWGAIGGVLGAVVGIFFGLPGLLLGPLIGAVGGELLAGRGLLPAGKSGWGTFLGATAGLVAKVILGLLMVAVFAVSALAG
jgi:hypothetical protein